MKTERLSQLENAGVDTSRFFTFTANTDVPAGTEITVKLPEAKNPAIEQQILNNGYVKNTRLHRRFVMAQYMRMLNADCGWYEYLRVYYSYDYQFEMLEDEIRTLAVLERKDKESFEERSRFFRKDVIRYIVNNYIEDARTFVASCPRKNCRGTINIMCGKNHFIKEVDMVNVRFPALERAARRVMNASTYREIQEAWPAFKAEYLKIPYAHKKIDAWVNAFQSAGAYYTLKNMVMYHGVDLYFNATPWLDNTRVMAKSGPQAVAQLHNLLETVNLEGYQWHAILKLTIKENEFKFGTGIREAIKRGIESEN